METTVAVIEQFFASPRSRDEKTPSSLRAEDGMLRCEQMPEISRFFGIVIRMYFDDHNPPHFHATYAESEARIGIEPIAILEGTLPNRATSMVFEWAALHQRDLMQNWQRLHSAQPVEKIKPLE